MAPGILSWGSPWALKACEVILNSNSGETDFRHLTLFLYDSGEFQVRLFKSAATSAKIGRVAVFSDIKTILARIRSKGAPDVLFLRVPVDSGDALRLCGMIRARGTFPFPYLPIVAILEQATKSAVTAVRDAGVDEFLASPYSPRSLLERVQAVRNDRRGFVDVESYFGPDRRRGAMAEWLDVNRRTGPATLIDPVTEAVYTA